MTTEMSLSGDTKSVEEKVRELGDTFLLGYTEAVTQSDLTSERNRLLASVRAAEVFVDGRRWDTVVAAAVFQDMSDREIDTLIVNVRKICEQHRKWRRDHP